MEELISEENHVVWVDTETSGRSPAFHAVLEIAATLTDARCEQVLGHFEARCSIPSWASQSQEALSINRYPHDPRWKDRGTHEDIVRRFHAWLPPRIRLAGHQVTFDRSFLEHSFERYGLAIPDWSQQPIDTRRMAESLKRAEMIPNCKLTTVAKFFGLETENLHGARVDIDATREIYHRIRRLIARGGSPEQLTA